ncbi:hypothetical protein D3C77_317780 [compost metagenome]
MTFAGLIAFAVFGIVTSLWLKRFINRLSLVSWRFYILLAYNAIYGVAYIDLLKTGTVWGWRVSEGIYDYTEIIMGLCLALVLFHCWCIVSVSGSNNR